MANHSKTEKGDYASKKEQAMKRLAVAFEEILQHFHGEDNIRIREDIANYTIGYTGVSFGIHVKR